MEEFLASIGTFLKLLEEFAPFIESAWNSKIVAGADFLIQSKAALDDGDMLDLSNQIDQANAAADAFVDPPLDVINSNSSQGSK